MVERIPRRLFATQGSNYESFGMILGSYIFNISEDRSDFAMQVPGSSSGPIDSYTVLFPHTDTSAGRESKGAPRPRGYWSLAVKRKYQSLPHRWQASSRLLYLLPTIWAAGVDLCSFGSSIHTVAHLPSRWCALEKRSVSSTYSCRSYIPPNFVAVPQTSPKDEEFAQNTAMWV